MPIRLRTFVISVPYHLDHVLKYQLASLSTDSARFAASLIIRHMLPLAQKIPRSVARRPPPFTWPALFATGARTQAMDMTEKQQP
jgi:hypothetical protein